MITSAEPEARPGDSSAEENGYANRNNKTSTSSDDDSNKHEYHDDSERDEDEEDEQDTGDEGSDTTDGGAVVLAPEITKPSFGSISVNNSSDVHFGNKTYYQGPVTIKQFVYAKNDGCAAATNEDLPPLRDKRLLLDCAESPVLAKDNPGFVFTEGEGAQNGHTPRHDVSGGSATYSETRTTLGIGRKWIQSLSRQQVLLLGILILVLLASLIILSTVLTIKHTNNSVNKGTKAPTIDSNEQDIGTPVPSPLDPDAFNLTRPGKVKMVSRLEWLAQPPVEQPNPLNTPVPYVIIWHTATENCSDQATCVFHVRYIQTFHIESKHWWDIAYNFLVGGDGNVYEGRGWTKEGSHTFSYNARSIGIAFIGTFISVKPPPWQLYACKQLIELGVKKGYIAPDYKLLAAKQLSGTQAPGQALYEELQTWPHWSATP